MKRIFPFILAVILLLAACGSPAPQKASSGPAQPDAPASATQADPPREPEAVMAVEGGARIPVTVLDEAAVWQLQQMQWLEKNTLLAIFADGVQSLTRTAPVRVQGVLFDTATGEQRVVFSLSNVYIGHIEVGGEEIVLYDADTVYTLSRAELSLADTAPSMGTNWGAISRDLLIHRDDTGILLRDLGEAAEDIRVAEHAEGALYYGQGAWSPDGSRFLLSRHNAAGVPDGFLICGRDGAVLHQLDVSQPADFPVGDLFGFSMIWSADSRTVLVNDSLSLRAVSAATGEDLAACPIPFPYGDIQDVAGTRAACWREESDRYYTGVIDLATGRLTDLLETDSHTILRFSPDGDTVAAFVREDSRDLYLLEAGNG